MSRSSSSLHIMREEHERELVELRTEHDKAIEELTQSYRDLIRSSLRELKDKLSSEHQQEIEALRKSMSFGNA